MQMAEFESYCMCSFRAVYSELCQEKLRLARHLDTVPSIPEVAQYQKRFLELNQQVNHQIISLLKVHHNIFILNKIWSPNNIIDEQNYNLY